MSRDNSDVESEVQRIYSRDGYVTASTFLEESTPEDAPCHDRFCWDDDEAGHRYRLIQSRNMIRVVKIRRTQRSEPERLVHVAIRKDQDRQEGHYQLPSVIVKHKDQLAIALEELHARLEASKRALEDLERLVRGLDQEEDYNAKIAVALKALETANSAMQSLH